MYEVEDYDSDFAERLTTYISENYSNSKLKITDIAAAMGCSYRKVQRDTKRVFGVTPTELLYGTRIRAAKQILEGPNGLLMKQIADKAGFKNQDAFYKYFKKQEGISPTQYRDLHVE